MDTAFDISAYCENTKDKDVIIAYKGPITDVIISEVSHDIRLKFSQNPKIGRKLFSIFIELAQNVLYYSAEKVFYGDYVDRVGAILISRLSSDEYIFSCGNLVETEFVADLREGCEMINSFDRDDLRKYKREQRSKPAPKRSRGAGIGLIQVALTASSPLETEFKKIDDTHTFYSLRIHVKNN